MKSLLTFVTLVATGLVACGGAVRQGADPQLTSGAPDQHVGWPTLGEGDARFIRIDLGPDTFNECQRVSPKFPFDSAQAYAQEQEHLAALSACLNSNGMRDRTLLLVGRADPRGGDVYNDKLGMKRAEAIKQLLVSNGIAESRITIATEGAKGAVGDKPDYSFGYDRRVDVIVRGGTHSP